MQCIQCGKEDLFLKNLCRKCFERKYRFFSIPRHVDITMCYFCNSTMSKKSWVEHNDRESAIHDNIVKAVKGSKEIIDKRVKTDLKSYDDYNADANIIIDYIYENKELFEELQAQVRLTTGVCRNCSRQMGNYYESILQVRADNRKLSPMKNRIFEG